MEMKQGKKKQEIRSKKPDIRYLDNMRNVLYDENWAKTAPNLELYYMYRGLKEKNGLRYDITVMPQKMLGKEFLKTKGHEHSEPFPELYIVVEGEAVFLMQKCRGEIIQDVFCIKAKKREGLIIPRNYGHVTINPSKKTLKMANWINKKCKGLYDLFEKKKGACYYYTKSGWVKNKNYKSIPKLRFEKPLKSIPKNLNFLK